MAQSQNKTVEFHTTGVSYLGVGGKVGKMLVGNAAFEFYADANVEDYIQIPWQDIEQIGANVSGSNKSEPTYPGVKLAAILKSIPRKTNSSLLLKTREKS